MKLRRILVPIDLSEASLQALDYAIEVAAAFEAQLILLFAIDSLIDRAGDEVVVELWDGPGDLLVLIRDVVGLTRSMVPKRLTNIIDRLSG